MRVNKSPRQVAGGRTRVTIELPDGSNKIVLVGSSGAFYKSAVATKKVGNIMNYDPNVNYYSKDQYTLVPSGLSELGVKSIVEERVDYYENLGKRNSPKQKTPSPKQRSPSPRPQPVQPSISQSSLEKKAIELGMRLSSKTGIEHQYLSLRQLNNGAYGAYYNNGKSNKVFRIIQGAPIEHLQASSKLSRGNKQLSPKAASRAFNRYYKNRSYKSDKSRQRAINRDMCHAKSPKYITNSSKFRRSPRKFDYPGLDDGTNCKGKVVKQGVVSQKSLEALARGRNTLSNKRTFKQLPQSGGSFINNILSIFK
jgi:hypothetical protein